MGICNKIVYLDYNKKVFSTEVRRCEEILIFNLAIEVNSRMCALPLRLFLFSVNHQPYE